MWSLRKANVAELPGMRCITNLQKGEADVKFGPKTNYRSTVTSGVPEMTVVIQCSVPAAVTVVVAPWSETPGTPTFFYPQQTTFSGFRLQHPVGFTVELSETQLLIGGSRIRFDKIVSNFGSYYDSVNDYFRCPDDGLYAFSVSAHTVDPSTPWSVSRLMMNNEQVLQGPITYRATESYDSGSASTAVVLQCAYGSSVYVEAQAAHDFPHNSYAANLTSFSGYKLYDQVEDAVAFSAVVTTNVTLLNGTVRLPFDKIIVNAGMAFDVSQSEFVCPDDENYLFIWGSAIIHGDTNMRLCRDGSQLKNLYLTRQDVDHSAGTSGSSSISAIYKCTSGSKYYIEGGGNNNGVFIGGFITFSGFRVPGEVVH